MQVDPLSAAVRAELARLGPVSDLEVRMVEGIVTLSGSVPDENLRRRIEQRLLALPEVMDVQNHLKVTPPRGGLESQLIAGLTAQGLDIRELRVDVEDGVVTLAGRAASWFDRDAMARLAWTLPGVREVVNQVELPSGAVEPGRDMGGDLIP